jgi:mannitol-specific phosphotransferase system IIBC component
MSKFLDIIMPVGGGIGGGVVGVMEGSSKIQILAIQTIGERCIEMLLNIATLLPTMIIGAMVGWAVKKACDYFFNKYTKNGKSKKKIDFRSK